MTSEKHSILVRGRFDLTGLQMNRLEVQPGKIYGRYSFMNGYTSEIFFYGDRETMLNSIPDENFYTQGVIDVSYNAEHIFQQHLEHKNIEFIHDPNLQFVLKNGDVY
jgi:hypothetical protein